MPGRSAHPPPRAAVARRAGVVEPVGGVVAALEPRRRLRAARLVRKVERLLVERPRRQVRRGGEREVAVARIDVAPALLAVRRWPEDSKPALGSWNTDADCQGGHADKMRAL